MIRAFVDTNILLDIALARSPFAEESLAAYRTVAYQGAPPLFAPHSLATFTSIVRQAKGSKVTIQAVEGYHS